MATPIPIGTNIKLVSAEGEKRKLFKLKTYQDYLECVSTIAHYLRKGTEMHIQLLSVDKYRFHQVRTAYFSYLGEVATRADSDGRTREQLHKDYKRKYLLEIVANKHDWFADLVKASVGEDIHSKNVEKAIDKLLTIADGSIVSTPMLRAYFKKVENDIENREFETVGE